MVGDIMIGDVMIEGVMIGDVIGDVFGVSFFISLPWEKVRKKSAKSFGILFWRDLV